ncbi:MAG: flgK [Clostridiales bacterium]|jgi:flagellar hook-associated protein 1 FlgK|nr:flgK [Clostridiales bacterium]
MAASSISAQQTALNTTAHNLSNVNTVGFVRQQVLFKDFNYSTIGQSANSLKQVGLGTSVQAIKQIRDIFLDKSLRNETSRFGFYEAQHETIIEIENIFGEIDGESFSDIMDDLWVSIDELSKHPEGLENRGLFIQSAALFVDRVNLIGNQLGSYQVNLNKQITEIVKRINVIGQEVIDLNERIAKAEITGASANDFRDERNLLLDELAQYGEITYKELYTGEVEVMFENVKFISESSYMKMDVKQAAANSGMVNPIWVAFGSDVIRLDSTIGPENFNDTGRLKGLMLGRGTAAVNYTAMNDPANFEKFVEPSIIMSVQAKFDNLVHSIVTKINNALSPNTGTPPKLDTANAPYGLDGMQGYEVFKREYIDRYDALGNYIEEDPSDPYTLYASGNLIINPLVDQDYNKLCINLDKEKVGDATVVEDILRKWQEKDLLLNPNDTAKLSSSEYYIKMMYEIGQKGDKAITINRTEAKMITQIENQRQSVIGVSSDEELGNMIKYQHAYNAGARVVNTLSEMLEHIIMKVGRA